ncbi:MAG: hypothetical protein JKY89_01350 [Immundisolibacteraceae bacterium]|nr:hypothetical protein [Immundisolibacteraceae bacterium]
MIFEENNKNYELRYSFKALRKIEKDFGVKISELDKIGLDSMESLSKVFHAGLIHHHPEVTADESDEILDARSASIDGFGAEILGCFLDQTSNFYTKDKDKKKKKIPPPKNP